MGLMKLSGDPYDFLEDVKLSSTQEENTIAPSLGGASTNGMPLPKVDQFANNKGMSAPANPPMKSFNQEAGNLQDPKSSLPPLSKVSKESSSMSTLRNSLLKAAQYSSAGGESAVQDMMGAGGEETFNDYIEEYPQEGSYAQAYPEGYTPEANYSDYMAYDPYQEAAYQSMAYDPYASMYASPSTEQAQYADMAAAQQPAAQQPAAQQPAESSYEDMYNQVYQYLVAQGYSTEEAASITPSLLSNYTQPAEQQTTKTSSEAMHKYANHIYSDMINKGLSPQQAEEIALTSVENELEKSASVAGRIIGGATGALGGLGYASTYDDQTEGSLAPAVMSALAGAGVGAFLGGRVPSYFAKNQLKNLNLQEVIANKTQARKSLIDDLQEYAKVKGIKGTKQDPLGGPSFSDMQGDLARRGLDDQVIFRMAAKDLELAKQLNSLGADGLNSSVMQDLARAQANKALLGDIAKAVPAVSGAAAPAYIYDRYNRNAGGNNFVDNALSSLGTAGKRIGSAGDFIGDNPEYAAVPLALAGAVYGGSKLKDAIADRKSKSSKSKKKKS